ncbi:C40 family peptidase [Meridianimarinicoccus aquatilis]|uniref:NLP/P60 hydrolase n=1 Tax=Meridianimarinicoccus aquatilis TaxID=2552766 RepID=A0A4R6AY27_9RHOB|nr:NlpC/P60 family protein [Fluviibacterium aquatile]TDL86993.1 NLP/P60 hydrolase [Fluviibacterium aquatile]
MTGQTQTHPVAQAVVPVVDILDKPEGARQRQILYGAVVDVTGSHGEWRQISARRDGYTGFVRADDLGAAVAATHHVTSLATHLYTSPDIKSPDLASLSLGAELAVVAEAGSFGRTHAGYFVPMAHIAPIRRRFSDPVAVADLFLGTPYLWGGNSRLGLDCSGLVQAACLACGIACPGDSGQQQETAGNPVAADAPLARGDLVFWRGHVAMAIDDATLIHANAHHMAVVYEGAEDAIRRISGQGGGAVTGRRRLG